MKILGTKYQTYIDDKLVVLRLKKYNKDNNSYIFVDVKGRKVEVPAEEADKFVALSPDAIMNIMYTKSDNDNPCSSLFSVSIIFTPFYNSISKSF